MDDEKNDKKFDCKSLIFFQNFIAVPINGISNYKKRCLFLKIKIISYHLSILML